MAVKKKAAKTKKDKTQYVVACDDDYDYTSQRVTGLKAAKEEARHQAISCGEGHNITIYKAVMVAKTPEEVQVTFTDL